MAILIKARGLKKATKNIKRSASLVESILLDSVEEAARLVERELKENQLSGQSLGVRSGRTRASIHSRVVKSRMAAWVGTPAKHMPAHEYGATIKPKKADVLTVPLKAALTASGKARGTATQMKMHYARTFWYKKDEWKNPILFGVTAAGKLVPLFVGVEQVKLEKREPFKKAHAATEPSVVSLTHKNIQVMLDKENP